MVLDPPAPSVTSTSIEPEAAGLKRKTLVPFVVFPYADLFRTIRTHILTSEPLSGQADTDTRALLNAALSGRLNDVAMRKDAFFGFEVPVAVDGVAPSLLVPRDTWADGEAYDVQAGKLVAMFQDNFQKFEAYVDPEVNATAPSAA